MKRVGKCDEVLREVPFVTLRTMQRLCLLQPFECTLIVVLVQPEMPKGVKGVAAFLVRETSLIQVDGAVRVPLGGFELAEQQQRLRDRRPVANLPSDLELLLGERTHSPMSFWVVAEECSSFEGGPSLRGRFWIQVEGATKPLAPFGKVRAHEPEPPHVHRQTNEALGVSRFEAGQRGPHEGEPVQLPAGIDLFAYRIVQEALTNVVRHAGDAAAEVVIRYEAHALELDIVDDGRGRATSLNGSGHGLIGMRERVALYGGTLTAGTRAGGGGYAVRARLPLGDAT